MLDRKILLDDCLLTISMVYAVGPDDPVVSEGVARARATLARLRSRPLLDQLDAALAHGPYAKAEGKAASSADRKASAEAAAAEAPAV
jgi:hypothetical protein